MTQTESTIKQWEEGQRHLSPAQRTMAQKLAPQLAKAYDNWRKSQFEMGRLLVEYRKHFRGVYESLYALLDITKVTAHNYMQGYERAMLVDAKLRDAAAARGVDLSRTKHKGLAERLATIKEPNPEQVEAILTKTIKAAEVEKAAVKRATGEKAAAELETRQAAQPAHVFEEATPVPTPISPAERIEAELKKELKALYRSEAKGQAEYDRRYVAWAKLLLGELRRGQKAA